MDNYVRDYQTYQETTAQRVEVSVATAYRNMYGWMASALGLSAVTAYVVMDRIVNSESFANLFFSKPVMWGMIIASFAMVIALSAAINKLSTGAASLLFALYSVLMGAWISPVLLAYTSTSVVKVFAITAGMFAGMAVFGHVTKRDLSKLGSICGMALWGIIIASLVNLFFKSSVTSYIISYISVAVFTGLTMWDVQKFKSLIYSNGVVGGESLQKIALLGALSLYLDFLNLFLNLLRIMGDRK